MDSLVIYGHRIFSGGDRRVVGGDYEKSTVLGVVTRESGDIPVLLEVNDELYSCSTTGSIRIFYIAHDVSRMAVVMS